MNVGEALEILSQYDKDISLAICAHGFKGREGQAWLVAGIEPVIETDNGAGAHPALLLIEGAGDEPEERDAAEHGDLTDYVEEHGAGTGYGYDEAVKHLGPGEV